VPVTGSELKAEIYDDLDNHLPYTADIACAAIPMGMLFAWCVNLHLVNEQALAEHERTLLRVRMHECLGSELLVACGGSLRREYFNPQGRAFLDTHYAAYMDDFRHLFGEDCYAITDDWDNYARLAKVLTAKLMGKKPAVTAGLLDKLRHLVTRH
jgi:hypothetical protein